MEQSLLDFVVAKLNDTRGSWPDVSAGSGVPRSTIERIANGDTQNPGVLQVEKLAHYFRCTHETNDRGASSARLNPA
jgi:hypothetical protein